MIEMFWEYQIKGGIVLAISVLLYVLVLSNDHFYKRNRYWLIGSLLLPWIVPLLAMPVWVKKLIFANESEFAPVQNLVFGAQNNSDAPMVVNQFSFSAELLGFALYGLISLVFLLRLLYGYRSIWSLKKKAKSKSYKGFSLAVLPDSNLGPFSFFRTIFISEDLEESKDRQLILEHEKTHCADWHSVDLSLVECMLIFQWWNPFAWWLRSLIANNHEFCVDNIMLKSVPDPKDYQYSLLQLVRQQGQSHLVNNYNQSLTKKRIIMMNKLDNHRTIDRFKILLLLPILAFSMLAFTNPEPKATDSMEKKAEKTISSKLDLQKYIARRVKYPLVAQESHTEAKVIALVKVGDDGKVKDVVIAKRKKKSAVKIEEVVITSYKTAGTKLADKQKGIKSLEKETLRILNALPQLTKQEWIGQELQFQLQFRLQ
ncbi:M56 family metallopeptidase [Marinifilum caeruleilacunae]|uniref:Peptidase M56 domain-containing protein n=1 Tax=Marinifilum caeruleilacunae TaxID=2499076 RepID=A0ABX1X0S5_9BACT|nr:M56 family metallopeptidase [Marinifilum caeruleilacunae]NOU61703.1 hypothetical protein [Marinifilum caeruleilacunae]